MSGTQQTQTQTGVKPYKNSVPLINMALNDAMRAYRQGGQVDTTSHVVPMSNQTQQSYNGIMNVANQQANGRNGITSQMQDIIGNGGFNDRQNGAMNNMSRQLNQLGANGLSGGQDRAMGVYGRQLNRLGADGLTGVQDRVMQNYGELANSNYNPNANPGAQGVLNSAIRDTRNAVNLNAAAAGRYGSGVHEGVLADKVGDLSSNFRYNDFNNWLGRRDSANSNMASLSQQGLGNTQGLAQGMASLGQQGVQNRQGLSSGLFNAAQAGIGNMNTAYQSALQPFQSMAGVGAGYEDLARRTMDDRLRIFNETQNAPWQNIGNLLNVANLGGQYNATNSTTTAPGPNPFLQTLGGVTTGVGLLGSLGLF